MPVVVGSLHSQVPAGRGGHPARPPRRPPRLRDDRRRALPIAISDLVHAVTRAGLIDVTITAGHAFGGRPRGGVGAVRARPGPPRAGHADAAIVAMGPGVVGTSSPLGTTALEVASVLDAAAASGGTDRRAADVRRRPAPRHQGVSHHSRTALDLTRSPVLVAAARGGRPSTTATTSGSSTDPTSRALAALDLHVTTMGRGPDEDPLFFRATAAAGGRCGRRAPLGR